MGVGFYEDKSIPYFENLVMCKNSVFGISMNDAKDGYYLFEIPENEPMKTEKFFHVSEGITLELKVNEDDHLVLWSMDAKGNKKWFATIYE